MPPRNVRSYTYDISPTLLSKYEMRKKITTTEMPKVNEKAPKASVRHKELQATKKRDNSTLQVRLHQVFNSIPYGQS